VYELCFLLRSFGHLDVGNDRELKINYLLFLKWKIFRIGKVTNDFVFRQKNDKHIGIIMLKKTTVFFFKS
jgi:hypothetical protein